MTAHHSRVVDDDAEPPFKIEKGGAGAALSWKAIAALLSATGIAVAAWTSLKADVSNHSTQLADVHADLKSIAANVASDHDVISKLDSKLDAVLAEKRRDNARQ